MVAKTESFIDRCLSGQAQARDIDDAVEQWHQSPSNRSLHEALGFTEAEYQLWVEQPASLEVILLARKNKISLADSLDSIKRDMESSTRITDLAQAESLEDRLK